MRIVHCIAAAPGTGRATTIANVAYRLAVRGWDVACIDACATPDRFAAAFQLPLRSQTAHVPAYWQSVRDRVLVDCWSGGVPKPHRYAGEITLVRGIEQLEMGATATGSSPVAVLRDLLADYLAPDVLMVVVDGATEALQSGGSLLFSRLTVPDIYASAKLLATAHKQTFFVAVAFGDARRESSMTTPAPAAAFLRSLQRTMEDRLDAYLEAVPRLMPIPEERLLRWGPRIVTDSDVGRGIASAHTVAAFSAIADHVEQMTHYSRSLECA